VGHYTPFKQFKPCTPFGSDRSTSSELRWLSLFKHFRRHQLKQLKTPSSLHSPSSSSSSSVSVQKAQTVKHFKQLTPRPRAGQARVKLLANTLHAAAQARLLGKD
jgi:hypothetical protein